MLLYELCAMLMLSFLKTRNKYGLHGVNICKQHVTICVATELLSTSCIKHDITIPVNNTSVTICTSTDLLRWAALNPCYRFVVHGLETDRAQIRYSPYKICCVVGETTLGRQRPPTVFSALTNAVSSDAQSMHVITTPQYLQTNFYVIALCTAKK